MFDDQYMRQALELALMAKNSGDVPVGALVLDPESKEVIGKGYNASNVACDPTLHAEIIAIKQACSKLGSKLLKGCYIYVTLEPCAMCAAAISYAQLSRLYYGASDDKFGVIDSNIKIYQSSLSMWVPEVYGGILRTESVNLLQQYFALKR